MKNLYSFIAILAFVTFSAGRVQAAQAAPPTTQTILNAVTAVQTSVNNVQGTANSIQTGVNNLDTAVDNIQTSLDQIPPAWSQILSVADRFKLVMGNAAVLDRETGLVWEQSPNGVTQRSWFDAQFHCNQKTVGGRLGWRLPTIQELASLVDPNNPGGNPDLPPDHPFSSNVQSSFYWSATTLASNTSNAWAVTLLNGVLDNGVKSTTTAFVWCVRGGQGVDPQ